MRAQILVFLFPIIFVTSALGQARGTTHSAESALSYYDKIQLATNGEVEAFKKLGDRVKAGDRSLCDGYHGTDMSGCAKFMSLRMPAHSAEGLREQLNIPVTAAMKDRGQGFGERRAGLLLVDSFLTVVESVKPQKFFAKTIRVRTTKDRESRKLVLEKQNALLESFRQRALPIAETELAKSSTANPNPDPKVAAWEKQTALTLRSRLAKLQRRHWKIQ